MDIDDRYIDVDFEKDPNYVFGDRGARCFADSRFYDEVVPLVPRDQWQPLAEKMAAEKTGGEWLVTRIYNQKNEGSCVANATSQSHEIVQAEQFGKENVVHLSAISLYKRIGRSPNSGAMVDDGLDELRTRGVLPLDTPENKARFGSAVMPNTGFYTAYPSGWEETAKLFRADEYLVHRSVDSVVTALLKRKPVVVGRQGHSICYIGVVYKSGKLLIPYPNSWDYSWGSALGDMSGGFGFDSESQLRMSASWAFTPRTVIVPSR